VADVTETPAGDLVLKYEDIENGGAITHAEYDLVVLAVGVQPNHDAEQLFNVGELATDPWQWVDEPEEDVNPGATSIPGVYVAGAASGARDITESILHAGATVAQVAAQLERSRVGKVEVPA
jgi:heterodisulfide reductase subunit A-like polyferredoxin